ncbi:MAG: hypothetical protein QF578_08860 [Alphaproteobacteria bacterium]|jgi:hypothetical protein|nr:hypothetical protein [Alphaproteobacteria bacterium]MDP6814329.1 hypothetical protein [Alphaproteobacteria bacterium]
MAERLAAGQPFPTTAINLSDGGAMTLPDDMADGYKMIIFYRGSW